jgi:hypothetical protein
LEEGVVFEESKGCFVSATLGGREPDTGVVLEQFYGLPKSTGFAGVAAQGADAGEASETIGLVALVRELDRYGKSLAIAVAGFSEVVPVEGQVPEAVCHVTNRVSGSISLGDL